jgi:predicted RNA binding protein YcfA (HicA-like mRNA interferase family)
MSPRLPAVTSKQVILVLQRAGFSLYRHSGTSHSVWLREADGRRVTVPVHSGKIMKRKTLMQIINLAGLTIEEFSQLLRRKS